MSLAETRAQQVFLSSSSGTTIATRTSAVFNAAALSTLMSLARPETAGTFLSYPMMGGIVETGRFAATRIA